MIDLALATAFGYLLVLFRTAGLLMASPIFSAATVPVRVRLGIAVAVSAAVFFGSGTPAPPLPSNLVVLGGTALAETLIGVSAGLCVRMLVLAAEAAGSIAGLSAGLGYGALVDPFSGAGSTVAGQLLNLTALGLAVAAELPGEAIGWLARSVVAHPPGVTADLSGFVTSVITTAIYACVLSIRLSFPFLAASLVAQAALGILNRTTPSLNLSSVGFSISIGAGGVALYLVAPAAAEVAVRAAVSFFAQG